MGHLGQKLNEINTGRVNLVQERVTRQACSVSAEDKHGSSC